MQLKMNPEYRAEIRALKAAGKKIERDRKAAIKRLTREIQAHDRAMTKLENQIARMMDATSREERKIINRIAILDGRLA